MEAREGSSLETALALQKARETGMKAAGFGGSTTEIDSFGAIKVRRTPGDKSTVQFGKGLPIKVTLTNK